MSYDHTPPAWRVAEFWSSSNPGKKVLVLAEDQEIIEWPKRSDFIRWMDTDNRPPPGSIELK